MADNEPPPDISGHRPFRDGFHEYSGGRASDGEGRRSYRAKCDRRSRKRLDLEGAATR